ncbi:ATP-binding cassette domain-containing protein [Microbacterium istanbulense]|uniref:ATP-binding cassette domain-containing protein n=1 Tax=Microbacterium istanbulense TaxID=3122049 RepID=A0ABU8LPH3_9MICO
MITFENVSKTIGHRPIIVDVSFVVPDGRVTGFVGPNGAGKSTSMRVALGLTSAQQGQALFDGRDYRSLRLPLREVGSLLDARWLMPNLRARDVLDYCARTQGVTPRSTSLLALVGLADAGDRRVGQLSLGMRQRLGIAVALLGSPRHLILDEPLNGLDPGGIAWLRDLIRQLRDEGVGILLSSHIVSELALIADNIVVINKGRIVLDGTLDELAIQSRPHVLARTERPDDLAQATRARGATSAHDVTGRVVISGLTAREVFHVAAHLGIALDELTTRERSLDDIYRDAIGETIIQEGE